MMTAFTTMWFKLLFSYLVRDMHQNIVFLNNYFKNVTLYFVFLCHSFKAQTFKAKWRFCITSDIGYVKLKTPVLRKMATYQLIDGWLIRSINFRWSHSSITCIISCEFPLNSWKGFTLPILSRQHLSLLFVHLFLPHFYLSLNFVNMLECSTLWASNCSNSDLFFLYLFLWKLSMLECCQADVHPSYCSGCNTTFLY